MCGGLTLQMISLSAFLKNSLYKICNRFCTVIFIYVVVQCLDINICSYTKAEVLLKCEQKEHFQQLNRKYHFESSMLILIYLTGFSFFCFSFFFFFKQVFFQHVPILILGLKDKLKWKMILPLCILYYELFSFFANIIIFPGNFMVVFFVSRYVKLIGGVKLYLINNLCKKS